MDIFISQKKVILKDKQRLTIDQNQDSIYFNKSKKKKIKRDGSSLSSRNINLINNSISSHKKQNIIIKYLTYFLSRWQRTLGEGKQRLFKFIVKAKATRLIFRVP